MNVIFAVLQTLFYILRHSLKDIKYTFINMAIKGFFLSDADQGQTSSTIHCNLWFYS